MFSSPPENLTDTRYTHLPDYPMPEISAKLGLNWNL